MKATARVIQFPEIVSDPIGSRQFRASEVIARLQALIKDHGNLAVDGIEGIEFYAYPRNDPRFRGSRDHFFVVTGRELEIY